MVSNQAVQAQPFQAFRKASPAVNLAPNSYQAFRNRVFSLN